MKAAVLFGLNYEKDAKARLNGCVNDVHNVKNMLLEKYDFDDVQTFTEHHSTTAMSIVTNIQKLATTSDLEVAVIHYSGHGTSIRDDSGDESDGMDECILPSDYRTEGVITDDFLKMVLGKFRAETRVFITMDCCHSGTICDLRYHYKDPAMPPNIRESCAECVAKITMISGCMDNQLSSETKKQSGAMTSCLLSCLEHTSCPLQNVDMIDLLTVLRCEMEEKKFSQTPQLSSSYAL